MQQIRVRRFANSTLGFVGAVEPTDGSWIVLIDKGGEASFWRQTRCPGLVEAEEPGPEVELYVDAELPCGGVVRRVSDEIAFRRAEPVGADLAQERAESSGAVRPATAADLLWREDAKLD